MSSPKTHRADRFKNAASNLMMDHSEEEEAEANSPSGKKKRRKPAKPPKWRPQDWDGLSEEEAFAEQPNEVLDLQGEIIASQTWAGGSWSYVYEYNSQFYSCDEVDCVGFANAKDAFSRAGIGRDTYDEIDSLWIDPDFAHLGPDADE